jgi:subtilisin-like proprotein convertase family protein
MEHRIIKPIPDLGVVEDTITFPMDVAIQDIEITVEIRHTYRGDLRVILKPPPGLGNDIVLEDRTGGGAHDIVKSYRSAAEPQLFAQVVGKSAKGIWGLKVEDKAQDDVGVLVKWGLAVTY